MDKMSTHKKKIRAKTRENIQTSATVTWSLSPAKQQLFMVQELKYPVWSNSHRGLLLWMLYRIGGSLRRRARIWSPERFIRTLLALCWATLVPYLNKQLYENMYKLIFKHHIYCYRTAKWVPLTIFCLLYSDAEYIYIFGFYFLSIFSFKLQINFTFLVSAHPTNPILPWHWLLLGDEVLPDCTSQHAWRMCN